MEMEIRRFKTDSEIQEYTESTTAASRNTGPGVMMFRLRRFRSLRWCRRVQPKLLGPL